MANNKKYKYAKSSLPSRSGGFFDKVKEFFADLLDVISEQLGRTSRPRAHSGTNEYTYRKEQKRKEAARREKLLLAAILVLPLLAGGIMLASCNCEGCSSCGESCSSCKKDETVPLTKQDEEFRAVFDEAEEVYSWFTGCNKPRYNSEDSRPGAFEGEYYYRVTERGIENLAELRSICSEHFTNDIVDELLSTHVYSSTPLFAEFDGKLYYYGSYQGVAEWTIGERVGRITAQSDTELVYSVQIKYDYYSHVFETNYDYTYSLCEDGTWRFSKFELPAQVLALEMYGDGTNGSPEESQQ